MRRLKLAVGLVVVLCALTSHGEPNNTLVPPPADQVDASDAFTRQQIRIRKLHLVRPDLIPYPIAYDVVC
jgi:hypothetical protein